MTMADETDFLVCVTVLLAWKASTEGTLAVGSQEQYRAYEIVSIDAQSPLKANNCRLTLGSHDGQEAAEIPDVLVLRIPDNRTSDDRHDGVDTDEESSFPQLVRGNGDAEGVDGGGCVGRRGQAERGDLRVSLSGENLRL
jgi:hypothetical protein